MVGRLGFDDGMVFEGWTPFEERMPSTSSRYLARWLSALRVCRSRSTSDTSERGPVHFSDCCASSTTVLSEITLGQDYFVEFVHSDKGLLAPTTGKFCGVAEARQFRK
jgi:hypothetical protein